MTNPQNNFALSGFLQEEMKARGWTDSDVFSKMTDNVDQAAVFFAIYCEEPEVILDKHTAKLLSMIFDVPSQFFINLNRGTENP